MGSWDGGRIGVCHVRVPFCPFSMGEALCAPRQVIDAAPLQLFRDVRRLRDNPVVGRQAEPLHRLPHLPMVDIVHAQVGNGQPRAVAQVRPGDLQGVAAVDPGEVYRSLRVELREGDPGVAPMEGESWS